MDYNDIMDTLKKYIDNTNNFLKSQKMICAGYLYKFLKSEDGDVKLYNKFLGIYQNLSNKDKCDVFAYCYNIMKNDENKNEEKNLIKGKKGND